MKKAYLAPKVEPINIETTIIAASTDEVTRSSDSSISGTANKTNAASRSSWGNIWSN